jgi:hypothetical protein
MVEKMIKTYRGLLADDGQDRIRLSTIKGKVGYKIVKFALMAIDPNENIENAVKIYRLKQTAVNADVDFTDSDLLAAAMWWSSTGQDNVHESVVIFDQEIFNQDIYVTNADIQSSAAMNYYLELEVIPLDDAGAEYTTLKDMRQA